MAIGSNGTVFVGSNKAGNGVRPAGRQRRPSGRPRGHDRAAVSTTPTGVAFHDGALYVGEVSRISRFDNIERSLDAPPKPVVVNDTFPSDQHHGWKFIAFGPDGMLYVPVGGAVQRLRRGRSALRDDHPRMKPDGIGPRDLRERHAQQVGFDWHPRHEELWFTDNGRDLLGDDIPPDELNHAPRSRAALRISRTAMPATIKDPEFGDRQAVQRVRAAGAEARTARRVASACGSTPARCFRRSIATRSSSPSTARGTAARRSATA